MSCELQTIANLRDGRTYEVYVSEFIFVKGDKALNLSTRKRTGSGLETDWKQTKSRLEVDWKLTGSGLEADWKQTGISLEGDWKGTGSRMEADWKPHGSGLLFARSRQEIN